MKSVNFSAPDAEKIGLAADLVTYDASAYSSAGGPLHVSYANYRQPFDPYIARAFEAVGLTSVPGGSSGQLIGYSTLPSTLDPQSETRSSSETSFLQAAIADSSTLQVYQQTLANRIIFDENKTAVGVNVTTAGLQYTLSASKEVILSAGVVDIP